jgi:hypothetical protein
MRRRIASSVLSGDAAQALRRRLRIEPPAVSLPAHVTKEPIMTTSTIATSTAKVPTTGASRYLQQVCKHWAHNLKVEFTPEHGTIVFPHDARGANHPGDALVTFDARADTLDVTIDASSKEQLEGLKGAVARHVDRFAFREAPLPFDWHDG